jgi:chromosome segregation ATPase
MNTGDRNVSFKEAILGIGLLSCAWFTWRNRSELSSNRKKRNVERQTRENLLAGSTNFTERLEAIEQQIIDLEEKVNTINDLLKDHEAVIKRVESNTSMQLQHLQGLHTTIENQATLLTTHDQYIHSHSENIAEQEKIREEKMNVMKEEFSRQIEELKEERSLLKSSYYKMSESNLEDSVSDLRRSVGSLANDIQGPNSPLSPLSLSPSHSNE